MESKHKNALIGALLAVVFVMAVGYAAFAQQLTINGTAEITSTWDVHFDTDYNREGNGIASTAGKLSDGTTDATNGPSGSIEYLYDNQVANIHANLLQPGDTVVFTLKPTNYGTSLNAHGSMTVGQYGTTADNHNSATRATTVTGDTWGTPTIVTVTSGKKYTATKGYIKFTVEVNTNNTHDFDSSLAPGESDTIIVTAEYTNVLTNATDAVPTSAGISVGLNYVQV